MSLESPARSVADRRPLDEAGRALLFSEARTGKAYRDEPVDDTVLREIWDLAQWPPTATNSNPLRVVFVRSAQGRARLLPRMNEGNRNKVSSAPVTAILARDTRFHDHLPTLMPAKPGLRESLEDEARRDPAGRFNAALQAGYFILAVRAVGLVAGPMEGFDHDGLDAEFLAGSTWRSFLTVNIGHPGDDAWYDRLPRHDADDVVRFV